MMICSPGGIRGQRLSATSASLTWDEPYTNCLYCPYNASGYEVMADGFGTISVTRPPVVINGLKANEDYFFYIYALATGTGNIRSNPSRARIARYVPDTTPPSKPVALRAESVVGNTVNLEWLASGDNSGVVAYQVFCDAKPIGHTDNTRFSVAGLKDGTTYLFTVRAQDPSGNYADSDPLTVFVPDLGGPSIPGHLEVITITRDRISIGWLPSYGQVRIEGYEIFVDSEYRATTANTYYRVTGLRPGTTYSFSVRAIDALGKRSGFTTIEAGTAAN